MIRESEGAAETLSTSCNVFLLYGVGGGVRDIIGLRETEVELKGG